MTGRSSTARALLGATTLLLCACNSSLLGTRNDAQSASPTTTKPAAAATAEVPHGEAVDRVLRDVTLAITAATASDAPPSAAQAQDQLEYTQVTDNDIWHRVRDGFRLPPQAHPRIDHEIDLYTRHQDYLTRVSERAAPFMHLIVEEFERQNLPLELALLPIVESAFEPFAYSHGRAAGIWQFIPSTGRMFGLEQNWWYDGRRDVFAATQAAASFLKNLGEQFDNNWLYALAAYNAGPGNVRKAIKRNLERGKPTDFWHLDLPSETRQYVPRLLALREIFIHPEEHGIALTHISNTAHVEPVDTGGQIDLAVAAQMAGLSIDELYQLNPGYNRWATAPKGPHRLLLPAENVENFRIALADLPPEQRLTWQRHKIKTGETLGHIAQKFKVSVSMLREINNLRGNNIRAGKHLLVPTSRKKESDYTLSASNRLAQKQASGKGQRVEHTILPGDTLWDLSRSYGVGVHKLAKWNGLATRDALRPGKKLVLWLPEKRASTKQSSLSAQATRTIRYTVRRGDSLSGIAQRFNIRVADLKRWNRDLTGRRYLQPGQKLKLHIDVRQQSG